jgi:hypothetical protein
MATTQVQADLGGGVNVLATKTSTGIQYTINLASGATAGPYTGDQLLNVGTGLQKFPPPATFRLTFGNETVATSQNPSDVVNGENIVPNLFGIQQYAEKQLAQATATNAADQPATDQPAEEEQVNEQKLVPAGGGSEPYDELGNLNPGWEVDELGNPYYVGTEMVPQQEPEPVPNGPTSDPYDELGNLNPGWGLDEDNNPVWVGEGYIDATGENISDQKTVPNGPTSDPYDELGNLNPGWGLDEDNNPVWVGEGYIDATGENISDQKTIPDNSVQGTPYDDEGNLMPGWTLDEENNPVYVGGDFVEPATQASADQSRADAQADQNAEAKGAKKDAQSQATKQDASNFQKAKDWRVRLSLAPSAKYLYKGVSKEEAGILAPLQATDGVIFPYTPNVSVSYAANYDPTDLTHSNYKVFQYKSSSVDSVSITGDFTAQDATEASYLLAVIHFFRSVTKMFYGQDQNPKNGVPPPLVYLSGFGAYQFDNHPMAVTNFTYATPTDVDYIRTGSLTNMPGENVGGQSTPVNTQASGASASRLLSSNLSAKAPKFQSQNTLINSSATYVPTKVSISITAIPVVSRNDVSNRFSLREYATGKLLQGSKNNGGGIW